MKKTSIILIGLSIFTMLTVGCASTPKVTSEVINGTWKSTVSELTIDTVNKTLSYEDSEMSYEGNEIVIEEINSRSGTIFFKQTKALERCFEDPNDASWNKTEYWYNKAFEIKNEDPNDSTYAHWLCWWRYSTTAPDVGKWCAMSYKNLGSKNISIRFPWKQNGKNCCSTLEEAKSEFTIENGYFPSYGSLIKK